MVHPYLRRRNGDEAVVYPDAVIERVLGKTLGVPLFQEQVMRLAMVAGGFTPGEADQLRRAMGAWRRPGIIEQFRDKLKDGIIAHGYSPQFADQVFEQVKGFGEYGFPESHAASFALLAYVSAWLKCHYPAAFTTAILNSQPMGFYAPAQLIRDVRAHGVVVLPVDVNASDWDSTLEMTAGDCSANAAVGARPSALSRGGHTAVPALRLGLRLVRGLPEAHAQCLVQARGTAPFRSLAELVRRTKLGRSSLIRLATADAFGSLGLNRRSALWHLLSSDEERPLFAHFEHDEPTPELPAMPLVQQVVADYASTGLSLKAHPMSFARSDLNALGVIPTSSLAGKPNKARVKVAGLVLVRQQPSTAKGIVFATLEDESGIANIVIHPQVCKRYRSATREATALLVTGRLQRSAGVVHVYAMRIEDLSIRLRGFSSARSRDFH
jgi:error-prone DNA polymerase